MNKNVIRKLSIILAVFCLLPILLCSVSFAADDEKIFESMEKTDLYVMEQIAKTISEVDKLIMQYDLNYTKELAKTSDDTDKYEKFIQKQVKLLSDMQTKIDKMVAALQKKTLKKVNVLIKKAAKEDLVLVNDYIDVEIGGQIYQVDPFKVLR